MRTLSWGGGGVWHWQFHRTLANHIIKFFFVKSVHTDMVKTGSNNGLGNLFLVKTVQYIIFTATVFHRSLQRVKTDLTLGLCQKRILFQPLSYNL